MAEQDTAEALGRAGFEALRSIAESSKAMSTMLSVQTTEIRSLMSKIDDVQERVIRLEEQRHGRDIETLTRAREAIEMRIAALELAQASMVGKFQGAGTLASLVKNYFPLLAMAAAAFFWVSGYKIEK